jgi:hypothetical protein
VPGAVALIASLWRREYHFFFHHLSADERQSLKEYKTSVETFGSGEAALFAFVYFGESK